MAIVKATSSRTNLDWGKTVKKLILNNIFIDHSVRFLTDFTIKAVLKPCSPVGGDRGGGII